jgi:hypothetical protein
MTEPIRTNSCVPCRPNCDAALPARPRRRGDRVRFHCIVATAHGRFWHTASIMHSVKGGISYEADQTASALLPPL